MRATFLFLAATFSLLPLGCETGGVGDPCVPEDEYVPTFSGYKETETNVESRSFQCETRVCLVNHFRGRVTCPYGQTDTAIQTLPPDHPERCRIPGTSGTGPNDAVTVPVPAQLLGRTAAASPPRAGSVGKVEDSVYCSCRCANAQGGTDDGARYCECPSGFSCVKLIDDLGIGSKQLAGSYCVRDGTIFQREEQGGPPCDRALGNCG